MTIFVLKDGNRLGPFTVEQVVHAIRKYKLSMTDLAWHEGASDWVPLHTIKEVVNVTLPPITTAPNVVAPFSKPSGTQQSPAGSRPIE